MLAILTFFVAHWLGSVFFQTFFLHRYASHRMFTMSKGWERFFHLSAWLVMGPSYLVPRAYAILHRMHHAYSDTPKDPHSPRNHGDVFSMMWATKNIYHSIVVREVEPEAKFEGGYPEWPWLEKFSQRWPVIIAFGSLYFFYYVAFAPSYWWFLLLPIHWLMGPIHGAIVNWFGHRAGYRNFESDDDSRNTLAIDFLTLGELFQNNHHKFGQSPKFAVRRWEFDPTWPVIRLLSWVGIIDLGERPQLGRYEAPEPSASAAKASATT
jgi:stearoyl-CoA desaturase (delta-9 desaturase)